MTSLFLVTSAIYTSYGKCSTEERIEQTKETIKSIRTYAPGSAIVLLDAGEKSVNIDFGVKLIDYTTNPDIQFHLQEYLSNNNDLEPEIIIKSLLEIMMFGYYLKNITSSFDRIFKISGRYKLNSNFNYNNHIEAKDKVLLLTRHRSHHFYNFQVSSSMFQYMTRCWSFDSSLVLNIMETYAKMKKDIIIMSQTEKQGDIEHLLYKHLNKKLVTHTNVMGIEGYYAPTREWIEE